MPAKTASAVLLRVRLVRLWLGRLLLAGLVVPIVPPIFWTWDALRLFDARIFDARHVELIVVAVALFILLPPLFGLAVLLMEWLGARRRPRSVAFALLGAAVAALLLAAGWYLPFFLSSSILSAVAGSAVLVGTLIVLFRPHHPTSHRVAGIAGVVALVPLLLPVAPGLELGDSLGHIAPGREHHETMVEVIEEPSAPSPAPRDSRTMGLLNIPKLLDLPGVGPWLFLSALGSLIAALLSISLFSRDRASLGRAKAALWITAGVYAQVFCLPPGLGDPSKAGLGVLWLDVVFVLLRMLPGLGLLVYGVTDLAMQQIPPDRVPEAEDQSQVFGDARQFCLEIGREFKLMTKGKLKPVVFRRRKVSRLAAAVEDARRTGRQAALEGWVVQLRARGAVSAEEEESVLRELASTPGVAT